MNHKKLFQFALDLGELMLSSGAETFRVEDTMRRILAKSNYQYVEAFVTPTGIFTTMSSSTENSELPLSYIRRVSMRTNNMNKIVEANQISRLFCSDEIDLDEAVMCLEHLKNCVEYANWQMIVAVTLTASAFSLVFGGTFYDALAALIAGLGLGIANYFLEKTNTSKFFQLLIGGFIIGFLSIFLNRFVGIGDNLDLIIIGGIMPLVPGVAITTGIRDIINGDLVSGVSRAADAFIIAALIATGVGFALKIYYLAGGLI
ncbi:MAG: threonine/serine exporter family protein [Eubacteriales bacterium]|nr:threonine/serine exporter family protein [Eubacteriales bacterium]